MRSAIRKGILGGLAGGVVFGMMMAVTGMFKMIAGMMGSNSAIVGFLMHMMISAGIGAGFGVLLGSFASTSRRAFLGGIAYGALWWVLGPLVLMPWMTGAGLGTSWSAKGIVDALPSLVGHVIYGGTLGFVYGRLLRREGYSTPAPAAAAKSS